MSCRVFCFILLLLKSTPNFTDFYIPKASILCVAWYLCSALTYQFFFVCITAISQDCTAGDVSFLEYLKIQRTQVVLGSSKYSSLETLLWIASNCPNSLLNN